MSLISVKEDRREGKAILLFNNKVRQKSNNLDVGNVNLLEQSANNSDHESIRHTWEQNRLNAKHAKWVEFMQNFNLAAKHKNGKPKIVTDTLSRTAHLLTLPNAKALGIKMIKGQYQTDPDFRTVYTGVDCVYGINAILPVTLIVFSLHCRTHGDATQHAETKMKIHKKMQRNIEKATAIYQQEVNKHPLAAQELQIGNNTFKTNLPEHDGIPAIFNIGDLGPYYAQSELRTIRAEEGGNAISATRPLSSYEQHKVDAGNNTENIRLMMGTILKT